MPVPTPKTYALYNKDCLRIMRGMRANSVDTIITDPPYGLKFMGKDWDHGIPGIPFWEAALRVAKPGAMLMAFGGSRTYHRLACAIEDAGWELRDCVMWVYGSGFPKSHNISKAIDKAAGAEREVVGVGPDHKKRTIARGGGTTVCREGGDAPLGQLLTTPATDAARLWDGWGTALKPAQEIILCCQKPLQPLGVQGTIVGNLLQLEAQLWSLLPVSVAKKRFKLSQAERKEVYASAQWSADERYSIRAALSAQTDTSRYVSAILTSLSIVLWWKGTLAESLELTRTSTTETKTEQTIDWKTLKSCLSALTPQSIIQAEIDQPGSRLNALTAGRYLNAVCVSINAIQERSAVEHVIGKGHISPQDGLDLAPSYEPIILAMKPLDGTFAQNALKWGVAGLWIDGCRIPLNQYDKKEYIPNRVGYKDGIEHQQVADPSKRAPSAYDIPMTGQVFNQEGRWPANLVHDGSEEVLEGFPDAKSSGKYTKSLGKPHKKQQGFIEGVGRTDENSRQNRYANDSGSASRFFYCAKASKRERNEGLEEGQTSNHPTVKPIALLEYLCKLTATPIGGIVFDPFMGSGSTGVACAKVGRRFLGCENDTEHGYFEIAQKRVEHAYAQATQELS